MNKRLSPGKKNPTSSPDSAKITAITATIPRWIMYSVKASIIVVFPLQNGVGQHQLPAL